MQGIRSAIYQVVEQYRPMTVRQVFYQLVSRGVIDKTEAEYKITVCRLLVEMRRDGILPYDWIADNTRWMRKPNTYDSMHDMLHTCQSTYRRALWKSEYCPTHLYYFGDHDPSGRDIDRFVEQELRRHAPDCELHFERVAVTPEQIEEFGLQTRPTKKTDSRSKSFEGESVEVDAIDPDTLREICRECIVQHIDEVQLNRTLAVEDAERGTLATVIASMEGAAP